MLKEKWFVEREVCDVSDFSENRQIVVTMTSTVLH